LSKKRGNGAGSITKRNDGRWMARFTVHTAKGPKRRHIYGRTRQEVATKLAKAMTDRDGGIELDPSSVTVNEYLQRWLNDSVKGSVRPITFESYERLVRVHVVPALGRVKLKALSPAHLQGLYRDRLDAGLSSSTVQRLHAVIHRALKQALRWDLVPRNVSEAVDPPKAQRKEIRPLTPEQVRTLLRTAEEDRLGALYALAITTGLRQGELFGLRWEDVDLEAGRLSVCHTLTTPKGGRRLGPPKRSKSRRSVKLTTGAVKALRDHRERQLEEREKLAESGRTMTSSLPRRSVRLLTATTSSDAAINLCYRRPVCPDPSAFTISVIPAQRSCCRRTSIPR
jgi:integrase